MALSGKGVGVVAARALEVASDGSISADARCVTCGYDLIRVPIDGVCPECETPIHRSSGVFIAARDGLVMVDAACGSCGYSLRGLAIDGVCPECATPARPSVLGSRLEAAAPTYVACLARGAMLVSIAAVLMFAMFCVQMTPELLRLFGAMQPSVPGGSAMNILFGAWSLIGLAIYVVGWWMLTMRDPVRGKTMVADKARRTTRIGLVLMTCSVPVLILLSGGGFGRGFAIGPLFGLGVFLASVLTIVGVLTQYVRSMTYLGLMSTRMALPGVRSYADMMAWLGPVIVIVGSILAGVIANAQGGSVMVASVIATLGPAIVLVLYWRLVEIFRKELRDIRARQQGAVRLHRQHEQLNTPPPTPSHREGES